MTLDHLLPFKQEETRLVYESILAFPDQCEDAYAQAKDIQLPTAYKKVQNIVFAGMGGSNLALRLLKAVYSEIGKLPIELVNHYTLPGYADKKTLVIASSYSGNTEETLMVAQQAHKRGCNVLVLCAGGRLAEWAQHYKLPIYQFEPRYNPSGQPRMGLGYSLFTLLAIFKQLGYPVSDKELKDIIAHSRALLEDWNAQTATFVNRPKQIADHLQGFVPVWVASQHLHGNLRIANNQINETAKSFSSFFSLPELNHHLMEGLRNPTKHVRALKVIALASDRYSARLQKRYEVTKKVVDRNEIEWIEYRPTASTILGEACEIVLLSSFVSFYLSVLYKENPLEVPWVEYFKKELDR